MILVENMSCTGILLDTQRLITGDVPIEVRYRYLNKSCDQRSTYLSLTPGAVEDSSLVLVTTIDYVVGSKAVAHEISNPIRK